VKKTGRGEPIGATIQICMEMTQGNSMCSGIFLSQTSKNFVFLFLSFMFFFFTKSENRRAEQVLPWEWGVGTGGSGNVAGTSTEG
jgi:hypothetical protein